MRLLMILCISGAVVCSAEFSCAWCVSQLRSDIVILMDRVYL